MARELPDGVYEELVTAAVASAVAAIAPRRTDIQRVQDVDLPAALAHHFGIELTRALRASKTREQQLELFASVFEHLLTVAPKLLDPSARIESPPRFLRAVYKTAAPARPHTPLAATTLLTRNRAEPALGHELRNEIASADKIDLVAAFITVGGVRVVREALESFARRGGRMRVLTTVFTGTTEVDAVDALAALPGVEVRVSYDVRQTRLHAKAWAFLRNTRLHTAYVGSANLTATALGTGQEWMVKVSAGDLPHVIDKITGTFDTLWNDSEFESYDPKRDEARARLRAALGVERAFGASPQHLFTLNPFPFQVEILDRLAAERALHQRFRNLVVAATGTGKTVIAAFDYARCAAAKGATPRLLFVAHRREILEQARTTFRNVMHDASFGEVLGDGDAPQRWDHVFATVQSAATIRERVAADHFAYVVVDECHHAPADSYQALIRYLQPEILLGLTATPERADGKSLLPDFDGRVAAELRLWHALERQLLVPFEYYGIADGTDLTRVRWTRSGYTVGELEKVYTGNEARVALVIEQLRRRVLDVRRVRALAFCVSVEHAEYMARALTARGIPAAAVHGRSSSADRTSAPERLQARELNVLCTCDLYNEGIDFPFVDTLLLLRPTSSASVFLQQLGRGLRLHREKSTCLVLDFIGHHRAEFRFDDVLTSITGVPRAKLRTAVEQGFPFLPTGCVLELDAVAQDRVLLALKSVLPTRDRLTRELREVASSGDTVTLARFLEATGRELEDVYDAGGWTMLRARAGILANVSKETSELSRKIGWLLHTDEPARLRGWTEPLAPEIVGDEHADHVGAYARRMTMLDFQLHHRGVLREAVETAKYFSGQPEIREELRAVAAVLSDRIRLANDYYPVSDWPLSLHRHYTRREIVAAIGFAKPGEKGKIPQGGILKLEELRREILLVTLDKSDASFSPTTRYRDYAIGLSLFHWESQAAASVSRPSGRRYTKSPGNGWTFYLFVRATKDEAYAFLGEARLRSHEGDRPIAIVWDLATPMSAALYDRFATLAQG